jgi:hypothetical protein
MILYIYKIKQKILTLKTIPMKIKLYMIVFCTFLSFSSKGQSLPNSIPNIMQLKNLLLSKGIDEEVFVSKLKEKGIDLEELDFEDPDVVLVTEIAIKEVLNELEGDVESIKKA